MVTYKIFDMTGDDNCQYYMDAVKYVNGNEVKRKSFSSHIGAQDCYDAAERWIKAQATAPEKNQLGQYNAMGEKI